MNFIYDIALNFNSDYCDFFEWNKNDNIINIKKIPLFLVDNKCFKSLKYDNITVSSDFINLIKDKTYTYKKKKIGPSAIVSNGMEAIAVSFNNNGLLIKRSSLLIDEEEEVLDEVDNCDFYKLDIIKKKSNKLPQENRFRREKKSFLIKYIKKEKSLINLKYLYYDYFEKEENDIEKIKNILIKEINGTWNDKLNSFYNTVEIFSKIKN